ncbi:hypothetical protein N7520_001667 [Penicillium odoratum]|uniref:uncharacterized protein n=1 Tax=Penicillium odoratum TaxID=1167516 RepID=UPI002548E57B|nr:uncharacterized protein N7520_001667 [Penicillium odoratum]KAJ5778421.1 hypothetical protein N7520_001667 [Penicillium odoratum]
MPVRNWTKKWPQLLQPVNTLHISRKSVEIDRDFRVHLVAAGQQQAFDLRQSRQSAVESAKAASDRLEAR